MIGTERYSCYTVKRYKLNVVFVNPLCLCGLSVFNHKGHKGAQRDE